MNTCNNCNQWEGNDRDTFGPCRFLSIDECGRLVRRRDFYSAPKNLSTRTDFLACGYWKEKPRGPFYWRRRIIGERTEAVIHVGDGGRRANEFIVREGESELVAWLNDMWSLLHGEDCQCE